MAKLQSLEQSGKFSGFNARSFKGLKRAIEFYIAMKLK